MPPGDTDTMQALRRAASLMQAGRFDDASAILDRILASMPSQPDALQLGGVIARRRGDDPGAVALFRRSLNASPAQPHVWNNLGNALARLGQLAEAMSAYREALRLSPGYADALLNLGLSQITAEDSAACETLEAAVRAAPGNVAAWSALGRAKRQAGLTEDAIAAFRQALTLRPGDLTASHNLAVALRLTDKPQEALALLEACAAAAPDTPEIQYNLGHCYYDLDRLDDAFTAYRRAIALKPDYRDAHDTLNRLYWQHDMPDQHLTSYASAVEKVPHAAGLWADWANRLGMAGDTEGAISVLKRAFESGAEGPELHHRLGQALCARGQAEEGVAALRAAVEHEPDRSLFRHDHARALITAGRTDEALDTLAPALESDPFDQQALAYAALAWKLQGDPRATRLNDYDRFVKAAVLPAPPGYDTIASFNARLEDVLTELHRSTQHPLEQTLRGGSQTMGRLFDEDIEEIRIIRTLLYDAVAAYIAGLPEDPDHPFLGRRKADFQFSGSWSVRLRGQGFHVNHVHPAGWISSAYYVGLPPATGPDSQEGWIKFGESSLLLGGDDRPVKTVRPEPGMLVLFPSYFYHGTIPFHGEGRRTTIAFDVAPESS